MGFMNISSEQRCIIALNFINEIGPVRFKRLMNYFGSAEIALNAKEKELVLVEGISGRIAEKITKTAQGAVVDKEIELAEKLGVNIVTFIDDEYPKQLKNLPDCPPVLYVYGSMQPRDIFSVAVVGTRRPTNYGRSVASKFSSDFALSGVPTISGLARGIDTEVHKSTMASNGRTIAVVGSGLNCHYPPENRKLEEKISKAGAVISEFPMNFPPDKSNFPRRNRIISGLALATVVVEADIGSGALITARFSVEQGKEVFAVPGPIFSKYSNGPHSLLKMGAHLAESAEDVIEEIKPLADLFKERKRSSYGIPVDINPVDGDEKKIIDMLESRFDGASIDYLSANLKIPASVLSSSLIGLELKGLIRSLPGKIFVRNR